MKIILNAAFRLNADVEHDWNNYPLATLEEMLKTKKAEIPQHSMNPSSDRSWKAKNKKAIEDLQLRIKELKTGVSITEQIKAKKRAWFKKRGMAVPEYLK